jgi:hypothetical protein
MRLDALRRPSGITTADFDSSLGVTVWPGQPRRKLPRAHPAATFVALTILVGVLVPLGLLSLGAPRPLAGAMLLMLPGTTAMRLEIMRLPHLLVEPSRGRARVAP